MASSLLKWGDIYCNAILIDCGLIFAIGPCVWFTDKSNSSITVKWDLESKLPANVSGQTGSLCVSATSVEGGALVHVGEQECVVVLLHAGTKTFHFTNAAADRQTIVFFFQILEKGSLVVRRRFGHVVQFGG